jgi:hypothetical protein
LAPPMKSGLLPLDVSRDTDGSVRLVLQKRGQRLDGLQGMKDVAAARDFRHGQGLSGPDSFVGVGDGCLVLEALGLRLQRPDAPGVGVAVIFEAQQIATAFLGSCRGQFTEAICLPQPKGDLPPYRASPYALGSDTPLKLLTPRNLRRWRTPPNLASCGFPPKLTATQDAKSRFDAAVREAVKGKMPPLAAPRNIGPPVKFSCVGLTVLSQERDLAQRTEQTRPPCRRVAAQGASVFTTDARNSNMQSAFGGAHLRRLRTVPKIVRYLGHKIGSNSMRQAGGHPRPRLPPAGAVKSVPQSPRPVRLKRWFDRTPPSPETDHDHQGTLLPNVSSDKVYGSLYRPRLPRPLSRRRGLP